MKTANLAPLIGGSVLAAAALAGGMWLAGTLFAPASVDASELDATYMAEGRPVTEFQLVDHTGTPFDRDDLAGEWTLLFFGFTHCPDICPMTLAELSRVHALMEDEGLGDALRTVFVTVDPERDTPERIESYVTNFRDDFRGLTGPLDEIDRLARDLGIAHIRHDADEQGEYDVDHGASILLINPDGELQAVFGTPHRAREIGADLATILRAHGAG